jgi:hypothetical protein
MWLPGVLLVFRRHEQAQFGVVIDHRLGEYLIISAPFEPAKFPVKQRDQLYIGKSKSSDSESMVSSISLSR